MEVKMNDLTLITIDLTERLNGFVVRTETIIRNLRTEINKLKVPKEVRKEVSSTSSQTKPDKLLEIKHVEHIISDINARIDYQQKHHKDEMNKIR